MHQPVLLIHGFASSFDHGWRRHGWTDLLADDGREVIAYDLPGHGPRQNALAAEFDDIAGQLLGEIAAHAPLDIVGFSAGARVSISLAARRPDIVRKLVLIGPSDNFLVPMDPTPIIDVIRSDEPPARASHATLRRLVRAPGNSQEGLLTFLNHATEHATPEFLALITSPTLVITGSEDANGDAGALRSCLPHAAHCEIDGCDHFRLPSDPRTIETALAFLRS